MSFRDILAIVTPGVGAETVIAFADQLAAQRQGRTTVMLVGWQPAVSPLEGYGFDTLYAQVLEDARKLLSEDALRLDERLQKAGIKASIETYLVAPGAEVSSVALRARHADVSIVARPEKEKSSAAHAVLEAALFDSGRPVIVVPPAWKQGPIGKHVLLAWKPTREAARAAGDAQDLMTRADTVSIVTIDASTSRQYGEQPGADISAHIAYAGCKTALYNLDSAGRPEGDVIIDQATVLGADLIVMGGYGRSRLREIVFGGVTRKVLVEASLPVLMSH
jgi:nucleotide-binding universal stress UspA family protein